MKTCLSLLQTIYSQLVRFPNNANGNPFSYETWTDTTYLGSDGMKVDYFVRITDVDEDSPSFEVSFTSAI